MGQFLNSIFVMFSEGGQAKKTRNLRCRSFGGDKRDRTADLLNTIQAPCQLNSTPTAASALSSWPPYLTGTARYSNRCGAHSQRISCISFHKSRPGREQPAQ